MFQNLFKETQIGDTERRGCELRRGMIKKKKRRPNIAQLSSLHFEQATWNNCLQTMLDLIFSSLQQPHSYTCYTARSYVTRQMSICTFICLLEFFDDVCCVSLPHSGVQIPGTESPKRLYIFFFTVASMLFGFSVSNLLRVTFLTPRIFMLFIVLLKFVDHWFTAFNPYPTNVENRVSS